MSKTIDFQVNYHNYILLLIHRYKLRNVICLAVYVRVQAFKIYSRCDVIIAAANIRVVVIVYDGVSATPWALFSKTPGASLIIRDSMANIVPTYKIFVMCIMICVWNWD